MKDQIGWMILDKGKPGVFDGRLPIYWLKKVAVKKAKEMGGDEVVKVTIHRN